MSLYRIHSMTSVLLLIYSSLIALHGVILDPSGRPIEGARIECGATVVSSDSSGNFEIPGDRRCEASVSKPGFATRNLTFEPTQENQISLSIAPLSERVVVSATGAPVAIEEAGVAATVFTGKDIEARQYAPVQDLLRDVAGLSVVQTGSNGGITNLFTRGGGSNSSVVLLDGIPLTDPGGDINLVSLTTPGLERIEVVRGPESALFGAEAASGAIQMFTRRGDPEQTKPHGMLSYERGSFSTDHWTGALDGGLASRVDYALTADQYRSTGQFPNNAFRNTTGTVNAGFKLSDATSIRVIYRTYDSYTGSPGATFYQAYNLDAQQFDRDNALSIRLDDARGTRFTQSAYFAYHRLSSSYFDLQPESYRIAALLRTVPDAHPRVYLVRMVDPSTTVADPGTTLSVLDYSTSFASTTSFSLTNRTSANYQGILAHRRGSFTFSYGYERQGGTISDADVTRRNNGITLYDQIAFGHRVFISGGARIEHSSIFGARFAPRGAVTFRLPTDTFLRFSLARGIKEPTLLQSFANTSSYIGNPKLRPEKTDSFEVGLSREWFGRRLLTEASYFRNLYTDLIQFTFDTFPWTWFNTDKSWARGMELSGTAKLTSAITLRANYTKLYTKVTQAATASTIGTELLRRPRNSGTVSLQFARGRWNLTGGARFVGERQDNDFVFGINRNPAYNYVYLSGSFQATRHLAPFIRMNNLLDEQYQESLGYSALGRYTAGGMRITW